MKGFTPTLLDKLLGNPHSNQVQPSVNRLTLDQIKESVAADLEALLNTRAFVSEAILSEFPQCSRSIVSYGLSDFAGLSLASIDDRRFVCTALERAISRHEPRLRHVRAQLEVDMQSINKLNFSITALLVIHASKEPVSFDAILKPSSLQYSISSSRRAPVQILT